MHFICLREHEFSQIDDRLRFAVGSASGSYSDMWTVDVARDGSFYATSKGLSRNQKLSIHPNVVLWGFTQQAYDRYQRAGKLLSSARSCDRFCFDEPVGRMRTVASILFAAGGLRKIEKPWRKGKPSLYFPPPPAGMAQVVHFSVGSGLGFPAKIEGLPDSSRIIGAVFHKDTQRSLYLWSQTIKFSLKRFLESNSGLFRGGERLGGLDLEKGTSLGAVVGCHREPDKPIRLIEISGLVVR